MKHKHDMHRLVGSIVQKLIQVQSSADMTLLEVNF